MSSKKINLRTAVQELEGRIDGSDERAEIALQISDLKLEQEKIKLELEKITLEQEKERLRRLQKNSDRRQPFFFALMCLLVLLYGGFFAMLLNGSSVEAHVTLTESEARLRAIELFLLGVIPTVLIAFIMKAIFSATEKRDDKGTEIRVSEAVPIKLITETFTKH